MVAAYRPQFVFAVTLVVTILLLAAMTRDLTVGFFVLVMLAYTATVIPLGFMTKIGYSGPYRLDFANVGIIWTSANQAMIFFATIFGARFVEIGRFRGAWPVLATLLAAGCFASGYLSNWTVSLALYILAPVLYLAWNRDRLREWRFWSNSLLVALAILGPILIAAVYMNVRVPLALGFLPPFSVVVAALISAYRGARPAIFLAIGFLGWMYWFAIQISLLRQLSEIGGGDLGDILLRFFFRNTSMPVAMAWLTFFVLISIGDRLGGSRPARPGGDLAATAATPSPNEGVTGLKISPELT